MLPVSSNPLMPSWFGAMFLKAQAAAAACRPMIRPTPTPTAAPSTIALAEPLTSVGTESPAPAPAPVQSKPLLKRARKDKKRKQTSSAHMIEAQADVDMVTKEDTSTKRDSNRPQKRRRRKGRRQDSLSPVHMEPLQCLEPSSQEPKLSPVLESSQPMQPLPQAPLVTTVVTSEPSANENVVGIGAPAAAEAPTRPVTELPPPLPLPLSQLDRFNAFWNQVPEERDSAAGYQMCLELAEEGYSKAMIVVGNDLIAGKTIVGLKPELAHAWIWYQQASEKGSILGKRRWAWCLLYGTGGAPKDISHGIRLLEELIEDTNSLALYELIWFYRHSEELYAELTLLIQADRDPTNHVACIYEAGCRLHDGLPYAAEWVDPDNDEFEDWVEPDSTEEAAFDELRRSSARFSRPDSPTLLADAWIDRWRFAADAGYPPAFHRLGQYYFEKKPKEGTRNLEEAIKWFRDGSTCAKATRDTKSDCLYRWGMCLLETSSPSGAENAFEESHRLRHIGAGFELGRLLLHQSEVGGADAAEKYTRACQLITAAAKRKHWEAITFLLADFRLQQKAILQPRLAQIFLSWTVKPNKQEHGPSLYEAHLYYRDGCAALHIPVDSEQALTLLERAGGAHHPEAAHQLACRYRDQGRLTEAVRFFRIGAHGGHMVSKCELGVCYRDGGKGVKRSLERALHYLSEACDSGRQRARFELSIYFLAHSDHSFDHWLKVRDDLVAGAASNDSDHLHLLGRPVGMEVSHPFCKLVEPPHTTTVHKPAPPTHWGSLSPTAICGRPTPARRFCLVARADLLRKGRVRKKHFG